MSLSAWQEWFGDHIYRALLVAATLEGLGLPVPSELLFLPGVHLAHKGEASLAALVLTASLGNVMGGMIGYGIAYWGGPAFLQSAFQWLGIRPTAVQRVEGFFARYGQATVFISRFVGLIRTATIYMAGAARMAPTRFVLYLSVAALIWNTGWVWLVHRFEHEAIRLLHGRGISDFLYWLLGLVAAVILGRYAMGWYRRRR